MKRILYFFLLTLLGCQKGEDSQPKIEPKLDDEVTTVVLKAATARAGLDQAGFKTTSKTGLITLQEAKDFESKNPTLIDFITEGKKVYRGAIVSQTRSLFWLVYPESSTLLHVRAFAMVGNTTATTDVVAEFDYAK